MVRLILILALFLTGCGQTFVKVGAGANLESGNYGFDERCALGLYAVGVDQGPWTLEYEHTSCFDARPELVTNQIRLTRKVYFGR